MNVYKLLYVNESKTGAATRHVRAALANSDWDYLGKVLRQRIPGPERAGSYYKGHSSVESLRDALHAAEWEEVTDRYREHLLPGTRLFRTADLGPGMVGVAPLSAFADHENIRLADPKGIGRLQLHGVGRGEYGPVEHSYLITGPKDEKDPGSAHEVWTFHPGPPVRPTELPPESGLSAGHHSAGELKDMALRWGMDPKTMYVKLV